MNLKYMTLQETVNLYCGYGKHVVISNGEEYNLISPFKDKYGNYRISSIENTLDKIFNYVSYNQGRGKEQFSKLEENGWKYHSIWIPPAPKQFEPGQLVDVLENANDHVRFKEAKNMVGQKGLEIKEKSGIYYMVWQKDKKDWWSFPHECLAPHIPEQPTDILIKDGKKYKVQIIEEIE